jgi:adenylyltransferase/sulfurtransferase
MAHAIDPDSPRFARQRVLPGFGVEGQRRLAEAHVVVLGAGGLGSAVVPALVAAGIGRVTVVDDDRVEVTNLHRQTLHTPDDVGRTKVESATDAAAVLSPETLVRPVALRFDAGNADELLAGADLVIDGTDDILTRYIADDAAARVGIPLVWGSAAKFSGQVGVSWDARGVSYRDLFPEPPADAGLSCEIDGILPTVCTVTGGMMAGEALKLLTGIGEPLLGRVVVYDALSGRTREIAYRRADVRVEERPQGASRNRETNVERVEEARQRRVETPARGQRGLETPTPSAPRPARPGEVEAAALADELASDAPPFLLDVREPWEADIATIPGSILIPLGELADRIGELDPAASVVVYCHLGARSAYAARQLAGVGFGHVRNLAGGIDAWSRTVDRAVARY